MGIGKDLTFYGNIKIVSLEMLRNEITRAQLLSASVQTNLKPDCEHWKILLFSFLFQKMEASH